MLSDNDKAWMDGRLEQVETKLLTEFYKWASPQEARLWTHSAALHAVDLELEVLSDRVTSLEKKGSSLR